MQTAGTRTPELRSKQLRAPKAHDRGMEAGASELTEESGFTLRAKSF